MNANILLNIHTAARQVRRTQPTKLSCTLDELSRCLGALGCHVDASGNFNVRDLLRAIRVNVEPVGEAQTAEVARAEDHKIQRIVRAWSAGAKV